MPSNIVPMQQAVPMVCDPACAIPPWGPFPPPWFGPQQPPWYPGANAGVTFSLTAPINVIRGHFWWDGNTLHMFDGVAWVIIGGDGSIDGGGTNGGGSGTGTVVISSTPPGNPVSGMQWWNGSILQMWDGVMWKVIGPGAAAGPVPTTTVVFGVTQPGYFTAPTGWGILTINSTPQVDTELGWDQATKKYRPTKAGIYLFECTVWEGAGGGLALAKNDPGTFTNDTNQPLIGIDASTASGYLQFSGTTVMNGTTDFVRLYGYSTGAQLWGNNVPPLMAAVLLP